MKARKSTLSFDVMSVTEYNRLGTQIFETTLRSLASGETMKITGKPWRVGTKVDFIELKRDNKEGSGK